MSDRIGAPGSEVTRREFLAATGATGAVTLAGCSAPVGEQRGGQANAM